MTQTLEGRPTLAPRRFQRALLAWYDKNHRDLPWRKTREPYRIWLSEIMLQQTRVAAVLEHYRVFLERFPKLQTLADADESQVLAAWSGLGYYRRARMMRQCAQQIMRDHHGDFPKTSKSLQTLPGIGRYTAAAIASIAFDEPVAVVDGNVERVLERINGRTLAMRDMWQQAQSLLLESRPGDFNQATMELGATVCTPRQPRCQACPVRKWCAAKGEVLSFRGRTIAIGNRRGGKNGSALVAARIARMMKETALGTDTITADRRKTSPAGASQLSPALQRGVGAKDDGSPGGTTHAATSKLRSRQTKKEIWCTLHQRDGHVRLVQRSTDDSLMAGMLELPQWENVPGPTPRLETAAKRHKITAHGASRGFVRESDKAPKGRKTSTADAPKPWRTFRHSITTTEYTVHVVRTPAAKGHWIAIDQIPQLPITGLTRKILNAAGII